MHAIALACVRAQCQASTCVLTHKEIAHQRGRQTEHNHQDVRDRQIDDEEIGDRAHSRRPQHHRYDETVAHQADDKDAYVRHTVDGGQRQRVPIEQAEVGQIGVVVAAGRIVAGDQRPEQRVVGGQDVAGVLMERRKSCSN